MDKILDILMNHAAHIQRAIKNVILNVLIKKFIKLKIMVMSVKIFMEVQMN